MKVRTRFAPSPTGFMHVGNFRTGLFAWLTARHYHGTFILRIEDTDKNREVEGSAEHIIDCFKALNLNWDEGVGVGGSFAPYKQSERLDHYKKWAEKLIEQGRAYADPYSIEELQKFREQAQAENKPFLFRNHRPENTPVWDGKKPLRFKSDPKPYSWHDEVMGDLKSGPEVIDDFILIKSDGFPTYNFAHIVDDTEMEITHIIRGQEFLASVPNYLNLYEALGVDVPKMATMPHILALDGKRKLSKRDGSKDLLDYLKVGYLPEALINFIASLGWNDGTDQEIFSIDQLIEKFSLDRVQRSGAKFDEQRLNWMNGHWIRSLRLNDLYERSKNYWPENNADDEYKKKVLGLIQERLKYLSEIPHLTEFFFKDLPYKESLIKDDKQLGKIDKDELKDLLNESIAVLEKSNFETEDIRTKLNILLEKTDQKPRILFSLIRIATTQAPASPELASTLSVLGKEKSLSRIRETISLM